MSIGHAAIGDQTIIVIFALPSSKLINVFLHLVNFDLLFPVFRLTRTDTLRAPQNASVITLVAGRGPRP